MTDPADCCVCIIDDDADMRRSLVSLFRSAGLATLAYGSSGEFLAAGLPDCPCCLVLDVRLSGESGLDVQDDLAARGIAIPIVMMTGHGDIPMTVRAMRAGAIDFLPKPFEADEMIAAVLRGLETDSARRAAASDTDRLLDAFARLTPREREVMALVAAGLMNKQVAGRLNLSEITVKIHRGNVMRKMEAQSLADLVRMAEQLGVRDETIQRYGL